MSKPPSQNQRLPRIHYRVVGQDDYMLDINVSEDGGFVIDAGDFTSHKPTHGNLDPEHAKRLNAALAQLGEPREHSAPADAVGFVAELTLGNGPTVRHYRFWEGALDDDPDLKRLVRVLETLG